MAAELGVPLLDQTTAAYSYVHASGKPWGLFARDNVHSNRRFDSGHFHMPPEYTGEWRVDTHPRLNRAATCVCIDAPHGDEGRQLHLIDIRGLLARGGKAGRAAPARAAAGRSP